VFSKEVGAMPSEVERDGVALLDVPEGGGGPKIDAAVVCATYSAAEG
jgi:hypothetical protein